jgi:hypothetical protein
VQTVTRVKRAFSVFVSEETALADDPNDLPWHHLVKLRTQKEDAEVKGKKDKP